MKIVALCFLGFLLIGCGQYGNPNDMQTALPEDRSETAYNLMQATISSLQYKFEKGQISDSERNEMIRVEAEELLKPIEVEKTPKYDMWMLADLLRITNRWPEAEKALVIAVKNANSVDRKVNDSLRLAQAMAKDNKISESIGVARSIFKVDNKETAPILPSVLYEIVPAAQGKGHDSELADLLTDAIRIHESTAVDSNTDEGKLFKLASEHHIRKASEKAALLRNSKSTI
jgi:hypothetical protein